MVFSGRTAFAHRCRVSWGEVTLKRGRRYLVWSNEHRMWWRPNSCGYTTDIAQAGRYTRAEAIKHSSGRDQEPGKPLPELPINEDDLLDMLIPPPKRLSSA